MDETPEIQPDAPDVAQIEPVKLLKPTIPVPDMSPKRIVLPQSVVNAIKMRHEQVAEAELNAYQRLYEQGKYTDKEIALLVEAGKITQPKNIFQLLQEKSMNAIFAFALSWMKNNWRTTVAGLSVFVATTLAHLGINLSQGDMTALMGIGYAIIFKFSDIRWDLPTSFGVVLMVLSLFLSPLLGGLGVALNPGTVLMVQQAIQGAIGFLLKDQQQIFTQPVPAQQ